MSKTAKLYAYVDETGQDTGGRIFAVCVVVLAQDREKLRRQLETAEQQSGKHRKKWHRSRHKERKAFIEALRAFSTLRQAIFIEIFSGQTKYIELTAFTTAKATLRHVKGDYRVTVLVDGLKGSEVDVFRRGLRDLHIKTRKISRRAEGRKRCLHQARRRNLWSDSRR